MSWIINPTLYKGTVQSVFGGPYFGPHALVTPVLTGQGTDDGFIAYLPNETLTALNVYTVSTTVSYQLTYSGNTFTRQFGLINERPWYRGVYDQIYYTPSYGWVLMSVSTFPGYAPVEWKDNSDVWQGDTFYTAATIPGLAATTDVVFTGRGVHKRTDPVPTATVAFSWPRWCKTEDTTVPYGVYTAVADSGATGTKTVGNPSWKDAGGNVYMRSIAKVAGHYEYTGLTYNSDVDLYVIGTIGSESGWWVGDEPYIGGNRTLTFGKPDGSGITGANKLLTWNGYIPGNVLTTVYMGEIGVYR